MVTPVTHIDIVISIAMAFLPWKFKEGGYQPAEATKDEHRPGGVGSLLTTIESLFGEPGTHEPMNIHAAYLYTCICLYISLLLLLLQMF